MQRDLLLSTLAAVGFGRYDMCRVHLTKEFEETQSNIDNPNDKHGIDNAATKVDIIFTNERLRTESVYLLLSDPI